MNNYFTETMATLSFSKVAERPGGDENPLISDLFNDKVAEVGYIQLIPGQNRLCITANLVDGDQKTYNIIEPRLEFLKFIFDNTNRKVKKAIRFYFQNSDDAKKQHQASKDS